MGGTCFWEAIIKRLDVRDLREFLPNQRGISPDMFVLRLKSLNLKTNNVLWNGEKLSEKQLEENFIHIKDFNENSIDNGYLCSICDPFIVLICELFIVNINHNYCDYLMTYTNSNSIKTLNFKSSKSHFSAI